MSFIAHDGINKNAHTPAGLFLAEASHNVCLFLGYDKPRRNGIEGKAQFIPDLQRLFHVFRRFQDIELPIIQRIGYDGRRQIIHIVFHMGQNGHHRCQCYFSIPRYIIDQQNFFVHLHNSLLCICQHDVTLLVSIYYIGADCKEKEPSLFFF